MNEGPQKINDNSSRASACNPGKGKGIFVPVSFQPKLTIGAVNDPLEHEADAMADKVMQMSEPPLQRQTAPSSPISIQNINTPGAGKEELQRKEDKEDGIEEPLPEMISRLAFDAPIPPPDNNNINNNNPFIQRKCAASEQEEKEQHIRRKESHAQTPEVNSSFESYVNSLGNSGSPLPADTRSFFEPRFGYDFSNVRVHTDSIAAKSADSINALAYTSGSNIVFNQNQFSPGTDSGKRLLGHELTHVVQQQGTVSQINPRTIQRVPDETGASTEASESDVRTLVAEATRMLTGSAEFFQLATVDDATLERVLTGWIRMAEIYPSLIETRLNNDVTLMTAFKSAFNNAVRVLFTRRTAHPTAAQTSVMQLYLGNLYRLPQWSWPNLASFRLTNEAQRRAFISSFTSALNINSLFRGFASVTTAQLESVLTYLFRLVTDTQNMMAAELANDPVLVEGLHSAYREAINNLLSRAALSITGETVLTLFMRYRYERTDMIHEWADRSIAGTTAAVPLGTSANPSGNITLSQNGFQITIEPDGSQTRSGATTNCNMVFNTDIARNWDGHNIITSFTPPVVPAITIRTDYGPGSSASVRSGYGRGTTADDTRLGNTSLGYHERSHSRDYLRFIANNPAPAFTGTVGMTRQAFARAVTQYVAAMNTYGTNINRTSELATDCVGSPNIVQFNAANGTTTHVSCP